MLWSLVLSSVKPHSFVACALVCDWCNSGMQIKHAVLNDNTAGSACNPIDNLG